MNFLHPHLAGWGSEESAGTSKPNLEEVVVYYCRTYDKAVSWEREREKGGHVLRDTTSRGLCVRVWPPHTSERRMYVYAARGGYMYVYYCRTYEKAVSGGGEREKGGHVPQ